MIVGNSLKKIYWKGMLVFGGNGVGDENVEIPPYEIVEPTEPPTTEEPSEEPTETPTDTPTDTPTETPTATPTDTPTTQPEVKSYSNVSFNFNIMNRESNREIDAMIINICKQGISDPILSKYMQKDERLDTVLHSGDIGPIDIDNIDNYYFKIQAFMDNDRGWYDMRCLRNGNIWIEDGQIPLIRVFPRLADNTTQYNSTGVYFTNGRGKWHWTIAYD